MIKRILRDKENIKYVIALCCIVVTITAMVILNVIQNKNSKLLINGIDMLKVLERDKIGVYIDGEVKKSGFIQIPKGENLEYALNRIGGITENADIDSIDLTHTLKNGEKILIPSKTEETTEGNKQEENTQEKININRANIEELQTLEGIGGKTAKNVIEYRTKKQFSSIEEIMEVKGIGEGKFEKIKEEICV